MSVLRHLCEIFGSKIRIVLSQNANWGKIQKVQRQILKTQIFELIMMHAMFRAQYHLGLILLEPKIASSQELYCY